jgi:hypothetical protein
MLQILTGGKERGKQVGAIGPNQLERWVGATMAS